MNNSKWLDLFSIIFIYLIVQIKYLFSFHILYFSSNTFFPILKSHYWFLKPLAIALQHNIRTSVFIFMFCLIIEYLFIKNSEKDYLKFLDEHSINSDLFKMKMKSIVLHLLLSHIDILALILAEAGILDHSRGNIIAISVNLLIIMFIVLAMVVLSVNLFKNKEAIEIKNIIYKKRSKH